MGLAAVFCAGGGGYSISLGFHHLEQASLHTTHIENKKIETDKKLANNPDTDKKETLSRELSQLTAFLEKKIKNENKWASITFILGAVLVLLTFFPVLIGLRLGGLFIGEKHSAKLSSTGITKSTA
jgi:hypothetical protein